MKIGLAKQDITPGLPIYMSGYIERKGQAKGIIDHLFAKAIVLEDNAGEKIVIISADLLYITKVQTEVIRAKINELTEIKVNQIVICVTHTHSGPLTFDYPLFGEIDKEYVEWLLDIIPKMVLRALEDLQECKLGWYQDNVRSIGKNRRNYSIKSETYLTILSFVSLSDELLAVMFNYNCHPTVLSAENLMISGDYPGAAVKSLEKIYGEDILFIFSNGASGDISTRFTRNSQTFDEKDRMGRILAEEVIKGIKRTRYESHNHIILAEKTFVLKERELPDEEQMDKRIIEYQMKLQELKNNNASDSKIRLAETDLHGITILKMQREYRDRLEYGGTITAIRIGRGCILTQPAELFSKLGSQIMKQSPFAINMVTGYANGNIGYLPDRISYQEGGYEALSCHFKCGSGEELVRLAVDTINKLKK